MWKDSIIEEIHRYRDEYSIIFNYDLHKICQDIRKKQGYDNRRVVRPMPRYIKEKSIKTNDIQTQQYLNI